MVLKTILDGSIELPPENVILYVTSNRRHLMPEYMKDNLDTKIVDGELHYSDAVEEKISLSDRFGLWLSFQALTQQQYLSIVEHWLKKFGIKQEQKEYRELALRWGLQRGSRSGRIANQFARDYAGKYFINN